MSRIYRSWDGKMWEPALSDGQFVLGDPNAASEKHHGKNKVLVRSEQDAIDLIRSGYSIRVKTSSSPSLVRKNLFIDGLKVS